MLPHDLIAEKKEKKVRVLQTMKKVKRMKNIEYKSPKLVFIIFNSDNWIQKWKKRITRSYAARKLHMRIYL